jgi:amino acid transporter
LPTINAVYSFTRYVYNFMGFELMSGAAEEMENPGRDIPKAIITAGVLITFFYLFATVGILLALPLDQLGLIEGVVDTLRILFGETGVGGVIVLVLGVAVLFTLLANMVTWTIGANALCQKQLLREKCPPFSVSFTINT